MSSGGPYIRRRLRLAWELYRQNFRRIFLVMLLVWAPFDLLISYMDANVFGEEDSFSSFRFSQLLDTFVGVIAYSAIIFLVHASLKKRETKWTTALQTGLENWSQMWWTRILFGVIVMIGLLCLIIPGIYLAIRMTLIDQVVTLEKRSGMQAIARSFELTEKRAGETFLLLLGGLALMFLAMLVAVGLPYFLLYMMSETSYDFIWTWLPKMSGSLLVSLGSLIHILITLPAFFEMVYYHWITDGVASFICSLIATYIYALITVFYQDCRESPGLAALRPPAPEGPAAQAQPTDIQKLNQ